MATPDLAIIVTSYQMPGHVRRVLESIAAQRTTRRLEVVVADDGSTDDTPRMVAEFAEQATYPVRFVTHVHHGFHPARCRNEGARHTTAPHMLFVDGDCLLPPDHIEQHLGAWRPGIVTCGYCIRMDYELSQQVSIEVARCGDFAKWDLREQRHKLRDMHFKSLWYSVIGHPTKPSFRSTNFAMARADYERVNGFDENFIGWGCEDDDFGRRLRSAGVQLVSVLNRTYVYHLWHPPAPTRPQEWKEGSNVPYLQRPIRLTRCLRGQAARTPRELTVRIAGPTPESEGLHRLLAVHGWTIEHSPKVRTDLELVCRPGSGRFGCRSDCRVLAVFDESLAERIDTKAAHIVLSKSGRIGGAGQGRLKLDDPGQVWATLDGANLRQQRAAA